MAGELFRNYLAGRIVQAAYRTSPTISVRARLARKRLAGSVRILYAPDSKRKPSGSASPHTVLISLASFDVSFGFSLIPSRARDFGDAPIRSIHFIAASDSRLARRGGVLGSDMIVTVLTVIANARASAFLTGTFAAMQSATSDSNISRSISVFKITGGSGRSGSAGTNGTAPRSFLPRTDSGFLSGPRLSPMIQKCKTCTRYGVPVAGVYGKQS